MVKGAGDMNAIKDIAEELVDLWYTNDVGDGNRVQRAERRKLAERIAEALQEERERCAKIAEQSAYVAGVDLSSGYTMACGVIADKIRAEGGA
jgi:hypothetical protein